MTIERRDVEITIHLLERHPSGSQSLNRTYHIPKAHNVVLDSYLNAPHVLMWLPHAVTDDGNHTWVYDHLLVPEGSQIAVQDRLEGYLPGMSSEELDILVQRYLDAKKAD